jgi:predicted NBD/HSP70 family sugar kinase
MLYPEGMLSGPVRHGTMRERNLAVLLGEVAAHQPATRAKLAEITGFTKTTVSNLISVLAGAGLVREGGLVHEGAPGRPGTAVSIDGDGAAGLGLEINVDYLAACVLDLGRRVRYRHVVAADNRGWAPEKVIAALARLADEAVFSAVEQGLTVAGCVVAVPGVLDQAAGRLLQAPNLGWADAPVAALLRDRLPELRLPVDHDNEANLAALGELWFGAGHALGDFLHVSGEIGIGAGIVVNGQVFRGAHGFAGELGHVVVEPDGRPCACGDRGCLEQVAGQEAILRATGLASIAELVDLLETGDQAALDAVDQAGKALGMALSSAVKLLDPHTVVLGGIFSPLGPWARPAVEEALARGAFRSGAPPVVLSPLAGGAAVLGAAGLVIERIIADPGSLIRA